MCFMINVEMKEFIESSSILALTVPPHATDALYVVVNSDSGFNICEILWLFSTLVKEAVRNMKGGRAGR